MLITDSSTSHTPITWLHNSLQNSPSSLVVYSCTYFCTSQMLLMFSVLFFKFCKYLYHFSASYLYSTFCHSFGSKSSIFYCSFASLASHFCSSACYLFVVCRNSNMCYHFIISKQIRTNSYNTSPSKVSNTEDSTSDTNHYMEYTHVFTEFISVKKDFTHSWCNTS